MEYMDHDLERPRIIAVDFDGCLCKNAWPEIGMANLDVIRDLQQIQQMGNWIILWTCRCGKALEEAVAWCAKHGLYFDAVNENMPNVIRDFGQDSRKIYADEYWDDKARMVRARIMA